MWWGIHAVSQQHFLPSFLSRSKCSILHSHYSITTKDFFCVCAQLQRSMLEAASIHVLILPLVRNVLAFVPRLLTMLMGYALCDLETTFPAPQIPIALILHWPRRTNPSCHRADLIANVTLLYMQLETHTSCVSNYKYGIAAAAIRSAPMPQGSAHFLSSVEK